MATIDPLVPRYSAEVQRRFDAVTPPGAEPLLLFRVMAKSARAWSKLVGGSLLDPGPLTLRQREIVIDRTCALIGCEYEWGVHVALFAGAAGLQSAEIAATVYGEASAPCWSPAESLLVAAADALVARGKLNALEVAELKVHFSEEQIIEIIQICGYYRTIGYLVGTFDLPLEEFGARFEKNSKPCGA